jgi:hypothetical protein
MLSFFGKMTRGGSGSGLFSVEPTKIQAIKNILIRISTTHTNQPFLTKLLKKSQGQYQLMIVIRVQDMLLKTIHG